MKNVPQETSSSFRTEIGGDDGFYSVVTLRRKSNNALENSGRLSADMITLQCDKIRDAVQHLIESYCQAFRVNFQLVTQPVTSSGGCSGNVSC